MHTLTRITNLAATADTRGFKLEDHPVLCIATIVGAVIVIGFMLIKGRRNKA